MKKLKLKKMSDTDRLHPKSTGQCPGRSPFCMARDSLAGAHRNQGANVRETADL